VGYTGALELVDVSDRLIGLERSPALTNWKVIDKNNELIASAADITFRRYEH
jgi:hypothetical protein